VIEKAFREVVIDKCRNRENQPFVNAVIKFHNPDAFIKSYDKEERYQSVKKILLLDFRQKTAEQIFSQRCGTNRYNQNIYKSRNRTLNEIFIQN